MRIQLSHLPPELLALILENIDIIELIHLRLVNSQWQAVIESLFHLKRSLLLRRDLHSDFNHTSLWLEPKEFTVINISKKALQHTRFTLSSTASSRICNILLFRSFWVHLWTSTLSTLCWTSGSSLHLRSTPMFSGHKPSNCVTASTRFTA